MQPREIINTTEFNLVIKRLAFQLIENHTNFEDTVLIGLQSKGVCLSDRLQQVLQEINPELKINVALFGVFNLNTNPGNCSGSYKLLGNVFAAFSK